MDNLKKNKLVVEAYASLQMPTPTANLINILAVLLSLPGA